MLHPKCTILGVPGPIIIGENCIIEEGVVLVNRKKDPMIIGDENVFEVGCRIEATLIGHRNNFGIKARVLSSIIIGNDCNIGPSCLVIPTYSNPSKPDEEFTETLQDFTVVFGSNSQRKFGNNVGKLHQRALLAKHLQYLREVSSYSLFEIDFFNDHYSLYQSTLK